MKNKKLQVEDMIAPKGNVFYRVVDEDGREMCVTDNRDFAEIISDIPDILESVSFFLEDVYGEEDDVTQDFKVNLNKLKSI